MAPAALASGMALPVRAKASATPAKSSSRAICPTLRSLTARKQSPLDNRGISQAAVCSSTNKKFVHQGLEARHASVVDELVKHKEPEDFQSRYGDDEPRKGSDVLVEALEREVRPTQELCVCS